MYFHNIKPQWIETRLRVGKVFSIVTAGDENTMNKNILFPTAITCWLKIHYGLPIWMSSDKN